MDWDSHMDPDSGHVFYYNSKTHETQWEVPEGFEVVTMARMNLMSLAFGQTAAPSPFANVSSSEPQIYENMYAIDESTGATYSTVGGGTEDTTLSSTGIDISKKTPMKNYSASTSFSAWSADKYRAADSEALGDTPDDSGVRAKRTNPETPSPVTDVAVADGRSTGKKRPRARSSEEIRSTLDALSQYATSKELTKNYAEMLRDHLDRSPYTRLPDKSFPSEAACLMCKKRKATSVFFPCEHMCICDKCIDRMNIGPASKQSKSSKEVWIACPLCMDIIKLILPYNGGAEVDLYWRWVYEIKPSLPRGFASKFSLSSGAKIAQNRAEKARKQLENGIPAAKPDQGSQVCCIL